MTKIHWGALAANYMFVANKDYVNLDTLEALTRFLYEHWEKEKDNEYYIDLDSANITRQFLYNNSYFESHFNNLDEVETLYAIQSPKTLISLEKFKLDNYNMKLIEKFAIKTQLENISSINLTIFKLKEYAPLFTLYIEDKEYLINKGNLVKLLQPICNESEEALLIMRTLIDLKYALYKNGILCMYSNKQVIGFKISEQLIQIILKCKK